MHTAVTSAPPAKPAPPARVAAILSDPAWLASVERVVRQRIANPDAVADVVQEACADAVVHADRLPDDDAEARKYLFGIVRNKVRMHVRARAKSGDSFDEEAHGERAAAPGLRVKAEEHELLSKIVDRVPAARWTALTWFVRVTMGDSLADIAREEGVDYATAHARYSRMRKELRQHALQLAAVAAALALVVGVGRVLWPGDDQVSAPNPYAGTGPVPTTLAPVERAYVAAELRTRGLRACKASRWTECLQDLDRARDLDAPGDAAQEVKEARAAALKGAEHEKP